MNARRLDASKPALAALLLALTAGCSNPGPEVDRMFGTSDSAQGRRPGTTWADASGNTDRNAFDAAWKKCEEDIRQSSQDPIRQVPGNLVLDCLKSRGWRQVPVK